MTDAIDEVEKYLRLDVARHASHGDIDYTLSMSLRGHRRQVLENIRDDGDPSWLTRNGLLENLADRLGISLVDEPEVGPVLAYRKALGDDRRDSGRKAARA
jgi:hypothetical protein